LTDDLHGRRFFIKRESFLPGSAFWGIVFWNSLGFAKPAEGVERAPSFFEAIKE